MRETIEEILRMFNVDPEEELILSLETLIKHERLDAEYEMSKRFMKKVDEATGRK